MFSGRLEIFGLRLFKPTPYPFLKKAMPTIPIRMTLMLCLARFLANACTLIKSKIDEKNMRSPG